MARMHRSTTAHIQLGMGVGKQGRLAPWRCVFPGGRQRDQSRGNETLQGRCEDGTTTCGETLGTGSHWLGAFEGVLVVDAGLAAVGGIGDVWCGRSGVECRGKRSLSFSA